MATFWGNGFNAGIGSYSGGMMIEQLVMAHFRVAQLHVDAGYCKGAEGMKLYTAAAARLLGEFRRTALALQAYGTTTPERRAEKNGKLYKAAQ
jgi:hypothetical protein